MKLSEFSFKRVMRFYLKAPTNFVIFALLLRVWVFLGVLITFVILTSYIEAPPTYSELTCKNGALIKTGEKTVIKENMHYINIKISEDKSEFYYDGGYVNDVDFLEGLKGQSLTICFYKAMRAFSFYNQYAEIIYKGKRRINKYEERRLSEINRIKNSKDNFLGTFFWLILLPLTLTTYILKKY